MTSSEQDATREVTLTLCERCIAGEGGECHTPGCALWMNRAPDVPIQQAREAAPIHTTEENA